MEPWVRNSPKTFLPKFSGPEGLNEGKMKTFLRVKVWVRVQLLHPKMAPTRPFQPGILKLEISAGVAVTGHQQPYWGFTSSSLNHSLEMDFGQRITAFHFWIISATFRCPVISLLAGKLSVIHNFLVKASNNPSTFKAWRAMPNKSADPPPQNHGISRYPFLIACIKIYSTVSAKGIRRKSYLWKLPSRNKCLTAITASEPGKMTPWNVLKLRGQLWPYLWKVRIISLYRLKSGRNL
jgi:hypothetical protein